MGPDILPHLPGVKVTAHLDPLPCPFCPPPPSTPLPAGPLGPTHMGLGPHLSQGLSTGGTDRSSSIFTPNGETVFPTASTNRLFSPTDLWCHLLPTPNCHVHADLILSCHFCSIALLICPSTSISMVLVFFVFTTAL